MPRDFDQKYFQVDDVERLRRCHELARPVLEELGKWLTPTYE